jgi:prepilin-type N-terminal cleavage/methylation domain-containing protein
MIKDCQIHVSIARGQRPRSGMIASAGLHPAFTLIEMVVSLSVVSIVFLAMGSVMVLASKALPTENDTTTLTFDASDAVQQLVSELQTATSVAGSTDKGIAFTVPDRDNDGSDEGIIYLWSGVPGDPLIRQYNGGALVQVLPKVYEFALVYDTKAVAQPDAMTESAEALLSSRNVGASTKNYPINKSDWIGQYFQPSGLPANAVGWSVTRVLVMARSNGGVNGQTLVQLRVPRSGDVLPSNTVLEQVTMYESNLTGAYAWYPFTFTAVRDLLPGKGLCLVLRWVVDKNAADIRYNDNMSGDLLTTNNAGMSWNVESGKSMVYYVYGTYTAPVPQPPVILLRSVTLTLNPGQFPASRVRTAVTALNQPQMP